MYLSFFFVRASVMLFVLRLLPAYKRWQQRVVISAFIINFLATAYTLFMLGFFCVPFRANWATVPNSRCLSKDVLVFTNQINAGKIHQRLPCSLPGSTVTEINQPLHVYATLPLQ